MVTPPPSDLFIMFVRNYPNSSVAKEWDKWGVKCSEMSGDFTKAMYRGDIITACGYADMINRHLLKTMLFPDRGD
jgi:hypothetical protein